MHRFISILIAYLITTLAVPVWANPMNPISGPPFQHGTLTDTKLCIYTSGVGIVCNTDPTSGAGDVVGPASAVDGELVLFDNTTGKLVKSATTTGLLKATSGVLAAATDNNDYVSKATADANYAPVTSTSTATDWNKWDGGATGLVAATGLASLGISAVENTAISTWAGSTNVTTLGTVATGTWNATPIGAAKGGTGQDFSGCTGTPGFNAGTASCDNAATHRTNIGLGSSNTPIFAGLTLTGALTVSTADNTHYGDYTNTGDLGAGYQAIGRAWYNSGSKLWKFRNFDNSATSEFFTSEGTNTGNFETSGTVKGLISVLDNTASPTASQVRGAIIMVAGTSTVTLPTAVQGMSVCVVDNAATASDIIVDVQAGDSVVLVGVTQAGGVGITNASGSSLGDYVCLFSPVANRWMVLGKQGTWASQ